MSKLRCDICTQYDELSHNNPTGLALCHSCDMRHPEPEVQMSNPYLIENLSVGHKLPNGWIVVAYAVSDRHAVIQASMDWGDLDNIEIRFATWTVSQDDLRSTASGQYHNGSNAMANSFADFKIRVTEMYQFS